MGSSRFTAGTPKAREKLVFLEVRGEGERGEKKRDSTWRKLEKKQERKSEGLAYSATPRHARMRGGGKEERESHREGKG